MSQTKAQLVSGLNLNPSAPATALQIDASGNINLDSNTLYVDATNNRVGLGTSSPAKTLDVSGTFRSSGRIEGSSDVVISDWIYIGSSAGARGITSDAAARSLLFGINGSEVARFNTSGRLGIGTQTPQNPLVVSNAGANGFEVTPTSNSGTTSYLLSYNRSTSAYTDMRFDASAFRFEVSATERARIDSSGRLLVGLSSANGATNGKAVFGTGNNNSTDGIVIINTEDKNTNSLVLSNWTGVAATQGPRITFDNSGVGSWACGAASGVDAFDVAKTWGTPLVRLDTSGRLLVGLNSTQAGAGASDKLQVSGAVNIVSSTNIYSRLVASSGGLTITANAYPANIGSNQAIVMSMGTAGGGGPTEFMRLLSTGFHRIGANAASGTIGVDYPLEIISSSNAGVQAGLGSYYGLITGSGGTMNYGGDNDNTVGVSFELSTNNIGGWRPASVILHVSRCKGDATQYSGAWYLYSFIMYNGAAGNFILQDSGGSTANFTISAAGTTGSWDGGTKQSVIVRFSVSSGSFADAYTTIYAELSSYNQVIRSQRESS
jgi:hypothetical protein